jgi:hypothetical protein
MQKPMVQMVLILSLQLLPQLVVEVEPMNHLLALTEGQAVVLDSM